MWVFGRKYGKIKTFFNKDRAIQVKEYDVKYRGMVDEKILLKLKFTDGMSFMFDSLLNLVQKLS